MVSATTYLTNMKKIYIVAGVITVTYGTVFYKALFPDKKS